MTRLIAATLCFALAAPLYADEPAGRRYALLVGVKDYAGTELTNLRHSENDVTKLADVLRDDGYRLVTLMTQGEMFGKKDMKLQPVAANIRSQLAAILAERQPTDTVLIAFAGHGVNLKQTNKLYFCPEKADLAQPETLIALSDVYDALKNCKAGTRLLIADACRNDAVATRSKEVAKLQSLTRPKLPDPPSGVAVLFSCTQGEMAYESKKHPHGVFFHHLLEGLAGKAANKKGEVLLETLVGHVKSEMPDTLLEEFGPGVVQKPYLEGNVTGAIPVVYGRPGVAAFNRGKTLLARHDYDGAFRELTDAIKAEPKDAQRYAHRAWALLYRCRFNEALADCDAAVKLAQDSAFVHATRAFVLDWKGSYAEALAAATRATELDPNSGLAAGARAEALMDLKRPDDARAEADRAVRLAPGDALVLRQRGVVRLDRGETAEAVADLTAAIDLVPRFPNPYADRGRAFAKLGQTDKAVADYTTAIDLMPSAFWPHYHRATAYAAKGDPASSIRDLTAALRIDPNAANALWARGTLLKTSNPAQSKADFAKYTQLTGKSP